ncbi:PQ-loop repeat family protein / transmembrane family protein [Citrus sinensis]|uniref:PQ-loop repeat family protein / transmembrane family protein n=1 Tax=Citrus sinensis TaxID=2711 RepID=A0ACB8JXF6_CITSI|nr:PQ-loop repeat family protein / transmembrane family protein [Citrus sinensis]
MGLFKSEVAVCPSNLHCAEWARIYMEYCLCSVRDGVSLGLGLASVISWGVAEVPQIITNYKEKSTEGLSIAFLTTWILGDLFNVFGCLLEPATLPTQYYMAMLYTLTTLILTAQTIYYSHIYPRLKHNKRPQKGLMPNQPEAAEKTRPSSNGVGEQVNSSGKWKIDSDTSDRENFSIPIPLPAFPQNGSPGRELYYTSARSLSSSHTPTAGSFIAQRMSPSHHSRISIEEPLLGGHISTQAPPSTNTKTMLCLVPIMIFLTTFNFHHSNSEHDMVFEKPNKGFVIQVRRKLLQVSGGLLQESVTGGSSGIGSYLGWAMAAIYMGGRLPQICLNVSILVNSVDWSRIRPNLPWLADAGGCVLLDSFILIQFIYYRYRSFQEDKHENSNSA